MGRGSVLPKLACVVLMCFVLIPPLVHSAITCNQVAASMRLCINYLKMGGTVPVGCCSGIRNLKAAVHTVPERRQACFCLKDQATKIVGINYGYAASLPSKCGVSVPYVVSPHVDCSTVK